MEKIIPEHVDAARFAEQNLHLEGAVSLADLPRLKQLVATDAGPVQVKLQFGRDEQGVSYLTGHLQVQLLLQCQRCMDPYHYEITSDFSLGIVNTLDEADALPDQYEPALAQEGELALRELIEDEVILNLPIIPRHELNDCKVKMPMVDSGWGDVDKPKNPFHVLESLKGKEQEEK